MNKTILFFIDGFGIGDKSISNPLYYNILKSIGYYKSDFKNADKIKLSPNKIVYSLDAKMNVEGLPQSATGQTSIFSGKNVQKIIGKHLTGFPDSRLRNILREENILLDFKANGYNVSFVNVFNKFANVLSNGKSKVLENGRLYPEIINKYRRQVSVTTTIGIILKQYFYNLDDLRHEKSIYQEFTNKDLIDRKINLKVFTYEKAANILFNTLENHDVVLYEYFQTDRAGHGKRDDLDNILKDLDGFVSVLEELITNSNEKIDLYIFSDHGNCENLSIRTHTNNYIPFIHFSNQNITENTFTPKYIADIRKYVNMHSNSNKK